MRGWAWPRRPLAPPRDVPARARPSPPGTLTRAVRARPGSRPGSGVMMGSKMASASRVVQVKQVPWLARHASRGLVPTGVSAPGSQSRGGARGLGGPRRLVAQGWRARWSPCPWGLRPAGPRRRGSLARGPGQCPRETDRPRSSRGVCGPAAPAPAWPIAALQRPSCGRPANGRAASGQWAGRTRTPRPTQCPFKVSGMTGASRAPRGPRGCARARGRRSLTGRSLRPRAPSRESEWRAKTPTFSVLVS